MSFGQHNIAIADKLTLGDWGITLLRKNINLVHFPAVPDSWVQVTAPLNQDDKSIPLVQAHQAWLHAKQDNMAAVDRLPRYNTGAMHYLFGKPYPLNVITPARQSKVTHSPRYINIYLGPSMVDDPVKGVADLLDRFYRTELMRQIPPLLNKWKAIIQVAPDEIRIKKMKTRWGTCNPTAKRIWLSLYLAQATWPCIEYVFVHEMVHFFEANHGPRFYQLMDKFLPAWREKKKLLNSQQQQMTVD